MATRQLGACFLVMLATGAILTATTQYLPQFAAARVRAYAARDGRMGRASEESR